MPVYKNGVVVDWQENWTDDLAYCLTHLALSYAYYHDYYGLDDEEAEKRAFYGVFESDSEEGTKARSVAKMWYDYLVSKPDVGIKIHLDNSQVIDANVIKENNNFDISLNSQISVEGDSAISEIGGKIEFVVPDSLECIVTGNEDETSKEGIYKSGEKVIIGGGQKLKFRLAKATSENLGNINISYYENYNVLRLVGGKDENGDDFQDIAGLYRNTGQELPLNLNITSGVGRINITKKLRGGGQNQKYYMGIFRDDDTLFDVVNLSFEQESELTAGFLVPVGDEGNTKYYIKETDENGVPLSNSNFKVSIDKEEIVLSNDNKVADVTVINSFYPDTVDSPQTGIDTYVYLIIVGIVLIPVIVIFNKNYGKNFKRTL